MTKTRIVELDALRGFALFGILLVNIFVFHAPYSYYGEFYGSFEGMQATVIQLIVGLAGGKFLFLFAILFGFGIQLQMDSQQNQFYFYFSKRMFILFLIGVIHLLVFWFGDILISYALLGILMVPLLKISNKYLIALSAFCILFRPIYYVFAITFNWSMAEMGQPVALNQFISTFQQGSVFEIFTLRMKEFIAFMPENLVWYIPKTAGLFMIGIYMARVRIIQSLKEQSKLFLAFSVFLIISSVFWEFNKVNFFRNFDMVQFPLYRSMLITINVIFETFLGFGYFFGFILFFQNSLVISNILSAAGRMALTNYLAQSFLCVCIFYSYGLGLYGKLNPSDLVIIATAIFLGNVLLSYYYLKNHSQGPLEYIWKRLISSHRIVQHPNKSDSKFI